jgi:epoxyqueuosine reductase
LEPDAPAKNHCGKCTRCLATCPTRAITAPFHLDARKCISYLTIELQGPIPVELRPAIGNRIFGCDDCLAVCPWNRFAREGNLMKSHARSYQPAKKQRAPSPLPSPPVQGERVPGKAGEGDTRISLQTTSNRGEIDLIELLQLDEAGFKSRFAGTPILRAKRRGFLRNVCIALGNIGDKSALPALEKAAEDAEPLIAEHARWAISQISVGRASCEPSSPL